MRIVWTGQASRHLAAAHRYLLEESSVFAVERQVALVLRAAGQLTDFPESGRPGRIGGTREMIVQGTPYLLAYRIKYDAVRVLALLHGARRWPMNL